MNVRQGFFYKVVVLSLLFTLAGLVRVPQPAWASMEDSAIFYEELNQHGDWVEYGNHGPVWYPTQVQENWRPYVDGRWTPSEEGYVFETQEPWGWATYHYGNWMPTEEYGWVWVPGRTWYPNTVNWRTSPETASPDESYIGWAPIPPSNYTPQPGYYPEGYYGGGSYRGPLENLITAPFWIFVKAASFLTGLSNSYSPNYSYWGCNCLVPPSVVPYYYYRTMVVHNYYTPRYYPAGYIIAGRGYYNWGPPLPYVARVTRINHVTINNYVRQVNIYQRRNVVPPQGVLARRAYFRDVLPPAMAEQRPLPPGVRVRDSQTARANLAQPHLLNASVIKNAPNLPGNIPKTQVTREDSEHMRRGVAGAALPASAMLRTNQQMENHLRKIPASQQLEPVSPRNRKWQVPQMPGATASQPAAIQPSQEPGKTPVTPGVPSASRPMPSRMGVAPQGPPQTVTPQGPGAVQETMRQPRQAPTSEGVTPRTPTPSQAVGPQKRYISGKPQPDYRSKPPELPPSAAKPGQPSGQGQRAGYTPSTPPPKAALPAQVQPQQGPPVQQPQPQQPPKRQQKKYTPDQIQGVGPGRPSVIGDQPRHQQYQPPPPRQFQQQPVQQPMPQVRQQPQPMPQPQVRQQPQPLPQRQIRQPQPQQPKPQAQTQPQSQQQQGKKKKDNQQN